VAGRVGTVRHGQREERGQLVALAPQLAALGLTLHIQPTHGYDHIPRRRRFAPSMMSLTEFGATLIDHPGATREELVKALYRPDDLWTHEHYKAAERRFSVSFKRLNMALPGLIKARQPYGELRRYYPAPDAQQALKRLLASGLSFGVGQPGTRAAPPP